MAADPLLSRELRSLQEQLATTLRERLGQSADEIAGKRPVVPAASAESTQTGAAATSATPVAESVETTELRAQLRDLVKELTEFVEDAEANISTHPAVSMVAAMLLGILIGSLLARR